MSETKVPPEFAWIKPGVEAIYKSNKPCTFTSLPKQDEDGAWIVKADIFHKSWEYCDLFNDPNKLKSITLTLTREQAEALRLLLSKQDGITRGFPEDERYYREIEKQIEEKLK